MAAVVIILLRVFFAVILGMIGVFSLGQAMTALTFQDFVLFGWPGAGMLLALLIGAGAIYASWRLFKTTLVMPAH